MWVFSSKMYSRCFIGLTNKTFLTYLYIRWFECPSVPDTVLTLGGATGVKAQCDIVLHSWRVWHNKAHDWRCLCWLEAECQRCDLNELSIFLFNNNHMSWWTYIFNLVFVLLYLLAPISWCCFGHLLIAVCINKTEADGSLPGLSVFYTTLFNNVCVISSSPCLSFPRGQI